MIKLLLFELSDGQVTAIIAGVIGCVSGVVIAVVGQVFLRPKTHAETRKLDSETDETYQKMRLDLANSLADWIKRFEVANLEMIAKEKDFETKLESAQDELDKCLKGTAGCSELKSRMSEILTKLETSLATIEIDPALLNEMRAMQKNLYAEA